MKEIRIDEPGAGEWIMTRAEGFFTPECDHSIANYRSGKIVGGFALTGFLGASATVHMAGDDPRWCSRDLMWMVFHYAFVQLRVRKVLALVRSDNYPALAEDLRAGFMPETIVSDVYPNAHMMILSMTRDRCKWLRVTPRQYRPGNTVEETGYGQ